MTVTVSEREIDIQKKNFLLKTHEIARPSRRDERYAEMSERQFAAAQYGWDAAKEADDRLQAFSASIVVRKAEEEAQTRKQTAEREAKLRADADAKILGPAWEAFRASGGTAEEFEKIKPQLLEQSRLQTALNAATGATNGMQPRSGIRL